MRYNVAIAFALMALYLYTSIFVCVLPWFGWPRAAVFIFTFLVPGLAFLVSYIIAAASDAGEVPLTWQAISEHAQGMGPRLPQPGLGRPPACDRCHQVKPLRTHHCKRCDRCVSKMDHHCKWLNNCVGYGNYKQYMLTLIYGYITAWYVVVLQVLRVAFYREFHTYQLVIFCISAFCIVVHTASFTWQLFFSLFLLLKGRTMIEHRCCEARTYGCNFRRSKWANWCAVFGPPSLAWFVPTRTPVCDWSVQQFVPMPGVQEEARAGGDVGVDPGLDRPDEQQPLLQQ